MAGRDKGLYDKLRASGLRKQAAKKISDAAGGGGNKGRKALQSVASDLRGVAAELEDRAKGGPGKRKAAAKKAAATRKRNARKRSNAAKKGARTRAKS
jgi:hypothetical protein